MDIKEFREKYSKDDIIEYIHGIDHDADHAMYKDEEEFLRDLYWLFLELFPDCDPYKQG